MLRSRGFRAAGLMVMALAIAHCGNSDVKVIGGQNVDPTAGTFVGTTNNGNGVIRMIVGSVESVTLVCNGDSFGGACDPVIEVINGNAVGTCSGLNIDVTFISNNQAQINSVSAGTACDGGGFADRTGEDPPTRTPTPVISGDTPTPTQTPGGTDVTETPTPETSPDACPEAARVEGMAGNLQVLDTGWTGLGHNARVISDGVLTINVNCTATERPCGVCNVSGPIDNPAKGEGTIDNRRCTNDISIRCTSTADCPGGTCNYFFGGPLPLVAGGVQTCVINEVTGGVSGTVNVESGAFASDIALTSRVFTGLTSSNPCPTCDGDGAANDGIQGGTCNGHGAGSAREGMPCDVSGTSLEFGPTSLDCPISGATNAIGTLAIDLSGSSGAESLVISAGSPNCSAFGFTNLKCPCDTCPNSNPCQSDADCGGQICGGPRCLGGDNPGAPCTMLGLGDPACAGSPPAPCGGSGQPTQPNQCSSFTCTPISGSTREGECATGPQDPVCSPTETFRSCGTTADCPFSGDTCVFKFRPCFLDNGMAGGSIVAQGAAGAPVNGVSNGTFATTFCVAPVSSGAINAAAGLPGAGRVELPIEGREIVGGVVAGLP